MPNLVYPWLRGRITPPTTRVRRARYLTKLVESSTYTDRFFGIQPGSRMWTVKCASSLHTIDHIPGMLPNRTAFVEALIERKKECSHLVDVLYTSTDGRADVICYLRTDPRRSRAFRINELSVLLEDYQYATGDVCGRVAISNKLVFFARYLWSKGAVLNKFAGQMIEEHIILGPYAVRHLEKRKKLEKQAK